MSRDISCRRCGEPWSQYAMQHDVADWPDEPDDAWERFASGDGCPTCDWGDKEGEVSRSRTESQDDLYEEHFTQLLSNSDDDPIKYI